MIAGSVPGSVAVQCPTPEKVGSPGVSSIVGGGEVSPGQHWESVGSGLHAEANVPLYLYKMVLLKIAYDIMV